MGKNGTQPTTKNVTPAVTPWGKNRVKNTETGNHVLIMPGIGYTVDRPLLYWAAQALAANGWFVDRLDLKLTESVRRRSNMLPNRVMSRICWSSPNRSPHSHIRIPQN